MTTAHGPGRPHRRRQRDVDTFSEFAAGAAPRLLRSALLFLGDRGAAEDATQVTLLRVFRRWDRVSSPQGFAASVLVNVCRDALRHRARSRATSMDMAVFELEAPFAASDAGDRLLVDEALARLPQLQREIVALRYLLDLSVADTASALGIPEGTVKSATSRAFDRLRVVLDPLREPDRRPDRSEVRNAH